MPANGCTIEVSRLNDVYTQEPLTDDSGAVLTDDGGQPLTVDGAFAYRTGGLQMRTRGGALTINVDRIAEIYTQEPLLDDAGAPLTDDAGEPLTVDGAFSHRSGGLVLRQKDC